MFRPPSFGGSLLQRKPPPHGVLERLRLLEDLLEHEVRVVALLRLVLGEVDLADLEVGRAAVERLDLEIVAVSMTRS